MTRPSTSDPEAFVRAFCESWKGGDIACITAFLTEDVVWENVPIGVIRGRAEAETRIRRAFSSASRIEWELLDVAVSRHRRVLTERIDRLHLPGGTVALRIMGIFELAEKGIALWRDYFDLAGYEHQLDLCGAR